MRRRNALIEVEGLVKRFGRFTAVDGVSLSVASGETVALVGPNGAGKTTLIKMLSGLLVPSEGKASVMGYDLSTQSEDVKRHIGYMSQRFSIYDDLTVSENLDFYGSIYGLSGMELQQKKTEMIDLLGLNNYVCKLVWSLGTGIRQRVAFAAATLHKPGVLFLDEPTSGRSGCATIFLGPCLWVCSFWIFSAYLHSLHRGV
jgi:ABC-2 type transport system ATP-binding protein